MIISILLTVFLIACMWVIFEKANVKGWKSIIPLYNTYCLFKITWGNGWIFLALLVPVVNVIVAIMTMYKLAKVFGKGIGYFFGLLLLGIVFYPLLAFSDAEYIGPNKAINEKTLY